MAQQLRDALKQKQDREQSRITIIRRLEVERRVGLSRSAIYRRISEGKFPQPVPLGGGDDAHAVGWIESEIDDYLVACIAARAAKAAARKTLSHRIRSPSPQRNSAPSTTQRDRSAT